MPHGESQDNRPDLKPCGFSTLGVDRAVPLWGTPHAGHGSENPVHHPLLSDIAPCLAPPGVAPGASSAVADAALVTEAHLTARGATRCIRRFPAPSNACGRLIAEAGAHTTWGALGGLAPYASS